MKTTFYLLFLILFTSCGVYPKYLADKHYFTLTKAECISQGKTINSIEYQGISKSYADSFIMANFMIHPKGIILKVENKVNGTILLNWDESSLVYGNGQSKIIHGGIKYINSTESIPSSVILKGTSITDQAVPSDKIKYIYKGKDTGYDWIVYPFINIGSDNAKELSEVIEKVNLKGIKLGLRLEIDQKNYDYIFDFDFGGQNQFVLNPNSIDQYYTLDGEINNNSNIQNSIVQSNSVEKKSRKGRAWLIAGLATSILIVVGLTSE